MTQEKCNCPYKSKEHWIFCPLYTPPAQEELFDCSGCSDPNSEGTHQGHSKQHGCVGCLHEEKKHVSDCCKSDYSAYGDTVNYICNSCNKVCVVILLNPKNPDDYKAVKPPQPKEPETLECICSTVGTYIPRMKRMHGKGCPIYTPPAQEEKCGHDLENDCGDCGACWIGRREDAKEHLKNCVKPSQPKEPETLEGLKNLIRTRIESEYHKYHNHDKEMFFECVTGKLAASFVEKLKKESLSAAAEERKRVCEEIEEEVKKLFHNDDVPRAHGFKEVKLMDEGYNKALSKVVSLIENIKNSI